MSDSGMKGEKDSWAVGGGLLLGLGIGFIFLTRSVLIFIGLTIAGLGFGLVVTALLSAFKDNNSGG